MRVRSRASSAVACTVWPSCHKNSLVLKNMIDPDKKNTNTVSVMCLFVILFMLLGAYVYAIFICPCNVKMVIKSYFYRHKIISTFYLNETNEKKELCFNVYRITSYNVCYTKLLRIYVIRKYRQQYLLKL